MSYKDYPKTVRITEKDLGKLKKLAQRKQQSIAKTLKEIIEQYEPSSL
jgi:predicted DNA-binding protein